MGILDIKESDEEEEIELTLGLSIGGGGGGSDSFKKFEMKSPMSNKKKKREEEEEGGFEQMSKKLRSDEDIEGVNMKNPNLGVPILPMQLGFQYVPFVDGFGFHYPVIPCWIPPLPTTSDRNVIHQPIPLRPFDFENSGLSNQDLEVKNCDSFDLSKSSGLKDTDSSGSGGNSSSADSHYNNGSHLGNEIRTESNHSSPPSNQLNPTLHDPEMMNINVQKKSQQSNPSNQLNPTLNTKETKTNINNLISLSTAESNPTKPPHKVKEMNEECEMKANQIQSLPKMPCVSTTGDGPNGKTISGFLYRYTKAEVSIVCVCHGSSFSPAEFVKHAGGTDVTQPLKHIVVVQSPFS